MPQSYDLIVLGTGTAGSTVATACAEAGWTVAIVDRQPFGGTCVLRGCDPKKVLAHAGFALDRVRRLNGYGLTGQMRLDWKSLMQFKKKFTDGVPEATREKFSDLGIDMVHGAAHFTGERAVAVNGETLEAEHLLIATGSRPVPLGIPGEEHLTHSDDFLELDDLPRRIAFVGGGYISCEFAHLAARAETEAVHLIENSGRLLGPFEEDLVEVLQRATRAAGIQVHLNHSVQAIEKEADGFVVVAEGDGQVARIEADLVVHGAGRAPWTDDLGAEAAGIALDDDGSIQVDAFLRSTTNPAVFAAGDAARAGKPLTPVATLDAEAVKKSLLSEQPEAADHTATPSVVFTTPRLASVGMTEEEARAAGRDIEVSASDDAHTWYGPKHRRVEHAAYKIIVDAETGDLLGAHLLYPGGEEVINLFSLAMHCGLTTDQFKATTFTYPASGSDAKSMLP